MNFLFTKQRSPLFALTGLLLWVSLGSGLALAKQSCQLNAKARCSSPSGIANWVRVLSDHTPQGQSVQRVGRGVVFAHLDGCRKSGGFSVKTRLSQKLAPTPGALSFHQIYESHCNQRMASEEPYLPNGLVDTKDVCKGNRRMGTPTREPYARLLLCAC